MAKRDYDRYGFIVKGVFISDREIPFSHGAEGYGFQGVGNPDSQVFLYNNKLYRAYYYHDGTPMDVELVKE